MSKNFSNFLKEKEHKLENINEDFTKFIRNMFGSVNLQEEEQNFIFKVNQAFRRYANKLIGKQYQSKILGKLLPIDKARAESIYRNLKNNFTLNYLDIDHREFLIFLPLLFFVFLLGIYPKVFLDYLHFNCTNIFFLINYV